jgi:tetratricopeptide (TPR) repeat protein
MRFIFLIVSLFFLVQTAFSQEDEKPDYLFINYLIKNNEYKEAIYLLKESLKKENADSANFILGWSYYELKELDSSSKYLLKVSRNSDFYQKSYFFAAYNQTYLGNYTFAKRIIDSVGTDSKIQEIKNLEHAGIALLERDFEEYDKLSQTFSYKNFALSKEERKLDTIYLMMKEFKPKSRGMAVLLSTIIPGAGKMYVGKWGEGMVNFITVGSFAAMAIENYNKDKFDYKTIILSTLGGLYYLGNIWGAYHSVGFYRTEFYEQVDYQILYHIHIPLRNIFN